MLRLLWPSPANPHQSDGVTSKLDKLYKSASDGICVYAAMPAAECQDALCPLQMRCGPLISRYSAKPDMAGPRHWPWYSCCASRAIACLRLPLQCAADAPALGAVEAPPGLVLARPHSMPRWPSSAAQEAMQMQGRPALCTLQHQKAISPKHQHENRGVSKMALVLTGDEGPVVAWLALWDLQAIQCPLLTAGQEIVNITTGCCYARLVRS